MNDKLFDLNIEKILDNWTISDGLREVISNALDEQKLSNTDNISIYKDDMNLWHIRDFGRGLQYSHFTQNESEEKVSNTKLIGKFGVGLKDALATFDRNKIEVKITSKFGEITLVKTSKHDFDDITTLHAYISKSEDSNFTGTDFAFSNLKDEDVEKAKKLFLEFCDENVLSETPFGEIIEKSDKVASIYINGVKVSEEENFLFSYNVTNLDKKIKNALNRERTNVGRTAYSDRVKSILLSSKNQNVARLISEDLKNYSSGNISDEVKWIDVQEHAMKLLNAMSKVIFLTNDDIMNDPEMVDNVRNDGYEIITISNSLKERTDGLEDMNGSSIRNIDYFYEEYNDNFAFDFVEELNMTKKELEVFKMTKDIATIFGGIPKNVKSIKISNTMRKEQFSSYTIKGLWIPIEQMIVINRTELISLKQYSGVLIHEFIHAKTHSQDISRDFENYLTSTIGVLCEELLNNKKIVKKKLFGN